MKKPSVQLERFERFKREPRDINEHLDTLLKYANDPDVKTIVELGVNEGVSTTAFLMSDKKFHNVDVHIEKTFAQLLEMCKNENREINFVLADDLTIEIPECDLLFIDTNHIYDHLIKELNLHAEKSSKYIIMHDTYTFGINGIVPGSKGLMIAINEFLESNKNWRIKEHFINNNGLTVLERC